MARHTPECDRMLAAFDRAGLPLYVAYYRRRLPRFLTVQELISGGSLGRVTGIRYHCSAPRHADEGGWRVQAEQSGGGHFLDTGSHALDLLDFFFGPLSEVAGLAANHGRNCLVEDTVAMSFLAGDIPGVASWNFASAEREDAFTITGTEGRLVFSLMGNEPLRLEKSGEAQSLDRPNPPHVQQPLIQSVVDDLLGRVRMPQHRRIRRAHHPGHGHRAHGLLWATGRMNSGGGPKPWPGRSTGQPNP